VTQTTKDKSPSFEEAFARLEQILERMNASNVTLDESLKLFEEADKLIAECNQRLAQAERKVETLIKARTGDLTLNANQAPATANFQPGSPSDTSLQP
jgi:exodeoxyribonuclease VII small subunit